MTYGRGEIGQRMPESSGVQGSIVHCREQEGMFDNLILRLLCGKEPVTEEPDAFLLANVADIDGGNVEQERPRPS